MAKYFFVGATPRGCPLTGQARGPCPYDIDGAGTGACPYDEGCIYWVWVLLPSFGLSELGTIAKKQKRPKPILAGLQPFEFL